MLLHLHGSVADKDNSAFQFSVSVCTSVKHIHPQRSLCKFKKAHCSLSKMKHTVGILLLLNHSNLVSIFSKISIFYTIRWRRRLYSFGNHIRRISKSEIGPCRFLQHFFSCSAFGEWPTWQHSSNSSRIQGTDPPLLPNFTFTEQSAPWSMYVFYPDSILKAAICVWCSEFRTAVIQVWLSAILFRSCISPDK